MPAEAYAGVYYPDYLQTYLVMMLLFHHQLLLYVQSHSQTKYHSVSHQFDRFVTNASKVGYVNDENEFSQVRLSNGQRDVLYTSRMNPIADLPNQGLVVYGQKTTQAFASALDRINVARLTNYMRFNLDQLSRGF